MQNGDEYSMDTCKNVSFNSFVDQSSQDCFKLKELTVAKTKSKVSAFDNKAW